MTFLAILNDIRKECTAFDLFPVDPRLGSDFARGARQWLQHIPTRYFCTDAFPPAHETAMAFGPEAEQMQTSFPTFKRKESHRPVLTGFAHPEEKAYL